MKTRTPSSAVPQVIGTSLEGFKNDVAALMSPLQEVWGEIRKELGSGEKVKAAVHESGLDQTWNQLKEAAATVVQPWLTIATPATKSATPAKPLPKAAKKIARKTARKVAGKVSAVKKKAVKKAR